MRVVRSCLVVCLAACASAPRAAPEPRGPFWFEPTPGCAAPAAQAVPPVRASDTLSAASARRFGDAARAYAARRLPGGYAGGPTYVTDPARVVLWLRDSTARDSVLRGLPTMPGLERTRDTPSAAFEVRVTDYDAAVLYDWMHYLMARGAIGRGLSGWGIDVQRRIALDLIDVADVPQVLAALDAEHVPCRLVTLRVSGPAHTLQAISPPRR